MGIFIRKRDMKQELSDEMLYHVMQNNNLINYIMMLPMYNTDDKRLQYDRNNLMKSIHNYHRAYPKEHIDIKYFDALMKIASSYVGEHAIKEVMENVKYQLEFEKSGKASFKVDCKEILSALKGTILNNKNSYMGRSKISDEPFWNTIQKYDQELSKDYGHKVL